MLYVRFPLSLRYLQDLMHERGMDVSYEPMRYWWYRFASKILHQINSIDFFNAFHQFGRAKRSSASGLSLSIPIAKVVRFEGSIA